MDSLDIIYPPTPTNASAWTTFKLAVRRSSLINENHPSRIKYFRSHQAVLQEKKRQCADYKYTVHPLSKFNQIYEVWSLFFYGAAMILKTLDYGFVKYYETVLLYPVLIIGLLILDAISIINICFQFFIGYCEENTRRVELSKYKIAKRYFISGHLVCDLLSSFPRLFSYDFPDPLFLFVVTCTLLKLRRITTFIYLIRPVFQFFGIHSGTIIFLVGFFFNVSFLMHFMVCIRYGIVRYRLVISGATKENLAWVAANVVNRTLSSQYIRSFFLNGKYIFLIDLPNVQEGIYFTDEISVNLIKYVMGKFVTGFIWIVLLCTFSSRNTLRIKYEQVITELEEYLKAKHLPQDLKERLIDYYHYKYQKVFFTNAVNNSILSQHLKREMDTHLCQSLITHVEIFSRMHRNLVQEIISHFIPEIFLPNDRIINSGASGDCMYFIDSGTVAVFTPSGKELCHLYDGAYFGEIAILLKDQRRTASVIAIETTKLYRLRKDHFDKCLSKHPHMVKILLAEAQNRLEQNRKMEREYKNLLFEQAQKFPVFLHH